MPNFTGLWTPTQQLQARSLNIWPATPGAPTSVVATAGDVSASVAFTAPADTGFPAGAITSFTATSSPGGFTASGASSPLTVVGLTNGTAYTFTVTATNASGTGPASSASNSVTPSLTYVEDVFSTLLYTGGGSAQTFVNDIDLASNGGLVWMASRNQSEHHSLTDTARGVTKVLRTNSNAAGVIPEYQDVTAFNSNGFTSRPTGYGSASTCFWTFRKQPKFFDIVTYTGNGAGGGQVINHNLGSIPGFIICKCTSTTQDWAVCARTGGSASPASGITYSTGLSLNTTAAAGYTGTLGNFPTSTTFDTAGLFTSPGAYPNLNGQTYVAYLFAHDAGGFGLSGTDNVISCGSFTTNGSSKAVVNLGYEPQWILYKRNEAGEDWYIADNMRGWQSDGTLQRLEANTMDIEANTPSNLGITATGLETFGNAGASKTFYYIAIRKGPMKVPTDATKVFNAIARTGTGATAVVTGTGFPVDMTMIKSRSAAYGNQVYDKIRGKGVRLGTYGDFADQVDATNGLSAFDSMDGFTLGTDTSIGVNRSGDTYINWAFRRAAGFFDVANYTGSGSSPQVLSHNLAVTPEMMIVKFRNGDTNWYVYHSSLGNTKALYLGGTATGTPSTSAVFWNDTSPTSTQFTVGSFPSGAGKYVAYLFATCPGVSKVGSYTGDGTNYKDIDCGFTSGARFVLIRRTDSTGNWFVYDTVRGITNGPDKILYLNTAGTELTSDEMNPYSAGFSIGNNNYPGNVNGGTYMFLAIA